MEGARIAVEPSQYLDFIVNENSGSCRPVTLKISNGSERPAAFKLKTTSPTKFKVKTHVGFVKPGCTFPVTVSLLKEFVKSVTSQDRFLVLVVMASAEEVCCGTSAADIMRCASPARLVSFKLKCRVLTYLMRNLARIVPASPNPRSGGTQLPLAASTLSLESLVGDLERSVTPEDQLKLITEQLSKFEAESQSMIHQVDVQTVTVASLTSMLVATLIYVMEGKHLLPLPLSALFNSTACTDSWWSVLLGSLGLGS